MESMVLRCHGIKMSLTAMITILVSMMSFAKSTGAIGRDYMGTRYIKSMEKILGSTPTRSQLKVAQVLSGTQSDLSRELEAGSVYRIANRYIIPDSAEIIIREGVTLLFETDAGLIVQGKILVVGAQNKPVVFRGVAVGRGAWDGIKIFNNKGSKISGAWISGAKTGIDLSNAVALFSDTIFCGNGKAFHTSGHHNPVSTMENCLIYRNGVGVTYHYAALNFKNCSIVGNDGGAITGSYYGDIRLENCIVVDNGSGIRDGGYNGSATAHKCIIYGNKEFDVRCRSSKAGDFRENWWGMQTTPILMKKGDGVKIPNIDGNFVTIAGFLKDAPENCGVRYDSDSKSGERNFDVAKEGKDDPPATEEENQEDANAGITTIEPDSDMEAKGGLVHTGRLLVKPTPVPNATQIEKATKIAMELCEDDAKELKSGKLEKAKFAQKLIAYSGKTENTSVKFVLLRNAFRQFLMAGDAKNAHMLFDRVYLQFGGRFAAEMANYSSSTLRKLANSPKLSKSVKPLQALVDEAASSIKAVAEAEMDIGKRSADLRAKLKLAQAAVKLMDWELALKTYAEFEDKRGGISAWEIASSDSWTKDYTFEQVGDFWWDSIEGKDEQGLLFKAVAHHATFWYRKALAEEKMTELKTALVKKRMAKVSGLWRGMRL